MADLAGLNAGLLALVLATYLLAGTIKGVTGLGFPAICIGLTTLFLDPRTAIALVLFPMIVSNFWQIWRAGDILRAARDYAPFAAIMMIGAFAMALFAAGASDRLLYAVTGIAFVLFVVVNLVVDLPPLPDRYDRAAQLGFGASAGILGGLTAIWAPPIAIYLSARHRTGDEFVRASGLLISLGSIPLIAGYATSGTLTAGLALGSAVLVVPALLGFRVGEMTRTHLSPILFRRVSLALFLLLGLNLLRKALMD